MAASPRLSALLLGGGSLIPSEGPIDYCEAYQLAASRAAGGAVSLKCWNDQPPEHRTEAPNVRQSQTSNASRPS
jgi:hypothetical protein